MNCIIRVVATLLLSNSLGILANNRGKGEIMKNRPWYIWFSLIAFFILCADTSNQIMNAIKKIFFVSDPRLSLFFKLTGHTLGLTFGYIFLPMIPFSIIYEYSLGMNHTLALAVRCVQFAVLYLLGVYATCKHVEWRNRYLPALHNRELLISILLCNPDGK